NLHEPDKPAGIRTPMGNKLKTSNRLVSEIEDSAVSRKITIRNVSDPLLRALRDRARCNRHSMQKEIISILEEAVIDRSALIEEIGKLRTRLGANMTLDEIHDAINERRP